MTKRDLGDPEIWRTIRYRALREAMYGLSDFVNAGGSAEPVVRCIEDGVLARLASEGVELREDTARALVERYTS